VVATARPACVSEGHPTVEFAEFFRAEYPGLVRALYLLTADLGEAEELAQEAMARAYERWHRVSLMESPGGYVYRAAVNLNRKRLRHLAVQARRLLALPRQPHSSSGPEERTELAAALAGLPVRLREAFMLIEWLGMTAEEAGRILGIAPASVRSRIHRARIILRESLLQGGEGRG
jgi:RNA polymerase sigma factor (sigma-70 family)